MSSHMLNPVQKHAERSAVLPCLDYTNDQLRIAGSLLGIVWRLQQLLCHSFGMNTIQVLLPNTRLGDNVSSFESSAISF